MANEMMDLVLKITLGAIYKNYIKFNISKVRPDHQRTINQELKQASDYINTIEFNKPEKKDFPGLKLITETEVIEYTHNPELNLRLVRRKPKTS